MFKFIGRIFGYFWKILSWIRASLLNVLLILVLVVIFQALKSAPVIEIPQQSALFLAPSGALVDQSTYNPGLIDLFSEPSERAQETNIHELIEAIHFARDDDEITGLILRLDFLTSASMSKIEEVGQAINYFKESGKKVVAFADSMTQQQYLLASYADDIYINPMGGVFLTGFGVYRNYYKSAADKIALKFNVFRVGEYKDAIEPFIRDDMSQASREHIDAWLTSLWQRYTGLIESHRNLELGGIDAMIGSIDTELDKMGGDAAQFAVANALVDGAHSRLELKRKLIQQFGQDEKENIKAIGVGAYLSNPTLRRAADSENKIGLIVATGNILDGFQAENAIGSESLSKLIRKAREDEELSALVVRVDSGGGSAFASEVIREQLQITKDAGLPVYISMGSVAASGGYWISTPATEIWATPATLTGSIGVFGLIPNISGSLSKLGISSDGVGTSDLADSFRIERDLSPRAESIIQSSVENIYQRFINLVADARGTDAEAIHKIAQGRIWFGNKAQELGLVDELGSLQDVLNGAASAQGFSEYSVKKITRELSPKEQFIRTLMQQAHVATAAIIDQNSSLALANNILQSTNMEQNLELTNAGSTANPMLRTYARCIECIAP